MIKRIIYGALWLSIGLISAIDIYWSIILQEILIETELNPIGKFLITVSGGDIALFMFCKVVGLVVVLGFLAILYHYRNRLAWAIILGVSFFQFLLGPVFGQFCVPFSDLFSDLFLDVFWNFFFILF